MSVTIRDDRAVLDQADAVTNFNVGTAVTTDFAEANASIALAVNIATAQMYYQGTVPNLDLPNNKLIYLWSSNTALQNSWSGGALSSHAGWLSDGTNQLVLYQAGNDRDVFKHADGQVQFQCFLIDLDYLTTKNANGEIFANAGSVAAFNSAGITQIGSYYVTNSKALGGGYNTFIDIIRYGNSGLTVYGGTSGTDPGTFLDVVELDRSSADLRAYGIIREYTANTYGCQGILRFGSSTALGNAYFEDDSISLTFEDRDVADDKFKLYVEGNSTDTNVFKLSNSTISSARPGVEIIMSGDNINTIFIDNVNFSNLKNSITLATGASNFDHQIINSSFVGCGIIDPGSVTINNVTISESTNKSSGSFWFKNPTNSDFFTNLIFNSDGSGYGIYISETGEYNLDGFVFNGFSAGSGTAAVFNNSAGQVTLNIQNGESPTVYNGPSSTTTINNQSTLTITGFIDGSEILIRDAGDPNSIRANVQFATGSYVYSYGDAGTPVDIFIMALSGFKWYSTTNFPLPATNQSFLVSQIPDRTYTNP